MGLIAAGLAVPILAQPPAASAASPRAVTNTTVPVTASSLAGWSWLEDAPVDNAPVTPVFAPGGSVGTSSATYPALNNQQAIMLATSAYDGVALSAINSLSYSTYSSSHTVAPELALEVAYTTGSNTWEGRLVFQPFGDTFGWKTWNTLATGTWYASSAAVPFCHTSACTWTDVLAHYPNAKIDNPAPGNALGRLVVRVGETHSNRSNDSYQVDGVVFGTGSQSTTYDFQTTASPVAKTVTASALQEWSWLEDDPTPSNVVTPVFVPGGNTGAGSATFPPLNANQALMISRSDLSGTKLSAISALSYATQSSTTASPYLGIETKFTTTATTWQGRLVFVPATSPVGWHTWDTLDPAAGGWYASSGSVTTNCRLATPCPWSQILAEFPQARIGNPDTGNNPLKPGRLVIRAGGTTNDYRNEAFRVDDVVIGTVAGGVDTRTSYDFETIAAAPVTKTVTAANLQSWSWLEDAPIDNGPATPTFAPGGSIGAGSATFQRLNPNQAVMISRADLNGTKLAAISRLSYATLSSNSDAPALGIEIKYTPSATVWQGRLVFLPSSSPVGWHTWNTMDPAEGRWYASKDTAAGSNGQCKMSAPCSWAEVLAKFPQAQIGNPDAGNNPLKAGRLVIRAGGTTNDYSNQAFSVDNVVVGTVAGGIDTATTYDFETTSAAPVAATVTAAALQGWSWLEDSPNDNAPVTPVFAAGPTPGVPAGVGSATYPALNVNQAIMISRPDFTGVKLWSLSALSYSTYSTSATFAPQLGLEMKYSASATVWQGRLMFVPSGNTLGWHTWNTMDPAAGRWYASNTVASGGRCVSTLCTWAEVLRNFPQAQIGNPSNDGLAAGRLIVRVGDTHFDYSAERFDIDNLSVGVVAPGGVSTVKTWDFEPTLAGAPTNVVATAGNTSASLTWTAPAATGTGPITGYTVTGGGTCVVNGTTAQCTGLANGTAYTFTVQAVTAVGSSAGAASNAVTPKTVPSAPTSVTVTPADAAVIVGWSAPANGGTPITGYTVTATPSGGSCTTTTALTCTVTGLANQTSYTFTVTATNSVGTGPSSTGVVGLPTQVESQGPVQTTPDFTPVGPKRVFDTRPGRSPEALVPVAKQLVGGESAILEVPIGGVGGGLVPSTGVGAVSLNVTVTEATGSGFVTVYPCGNRALVSSVNFTAGTTVANGVITPLSSTGTVCFFSNQPVHLIADVNGWFASGLAFVPVSPQRVIDTRPGFSPEALVTIGKARIGGGTFIEVPVSPLPGLIPASGVGTVSLNVTAVDPAGAGYVTVYACGTREEVSSLNYVGGQTVANAVLAPISAKGTVCFYSSKTTDLVVDISGWLKSGSGYTGVGPKRVVDTRAGMSPGSLVAVTKAKIGGATVLEIPVTGLVGTTPSTGVSAVSLNVTATDPTGAGYLTVYPCGTPGEVSSLNYTTGQTVANAVITPVSATGTVCIYSQQPTDVIVDINGWFATLPTK